MLCQLLGPWVDFKDVMCICSSTVPSTEVLWFWLNPLGLQGGCLRCPPLVYGLSWWQESLVSDSAAWCFAAFLLFICLVSINMRGGSCSPLPQQDIVFKELSIAITLLLTSQTTHFDWVFPWHSRTEQENAMVWKLLVWVNHLVSKGRSLGLRLQLGILLMENLFALVKNIKYGDLFIGSVSPYHPSTSGSLQLRLPKSLESIVFRVTFSMLVLWP